MRTRTNIFSTIRTEGMLLPSDLLQRIASGDSELEGLQSTDYHLAAGEKLTEAISRSWNRLLGVWEIFSKVVQESSQDMGTGATRSRWLLPLFQEFGYGTLQRSKVSVIDGKEYPISHFFNPVPIHLLGFGIDLDKRTPGAAGAARVSPHGLMQEFLNRSESHLWGFVSNGFLLRILRDNASLTRQAYVEFDLKSMMEGEVYSDFVLLWLLCHQSRIEVEEGKTPDHCWLEKWSKAAQEQGTRALEDLRNSVEKAITALGSGFLSCRTNNVLREKLRSGSLDKQDYYRQILRVVYRMIFLFAADDRDQLLLPDADPKAKDLYNTYYSTQRLRRLSQKTSGTRHCDLYRSIGLIFDKLEKTGCPELALPALGSFLWSRNAVPDLADCDIANRDFLDCIRTLGFTTRNNTLIVVDYKNLGAEELGSVYESLLELHPDLNTDIATFELSTAGGHERKTTGSYYTPTSLINCLLDSALEPVIAEAVKKPDPEKAILDLKVCDPACGSGHFLVAAAHRIAKRLAAVRTGDEEPSPQAQRHALRDVIGRCIYGVDINPMSVELCKINLWLEAIEPGKPLSFLDHHIKCGNSLLGTTPALMDKGIPDEAFATIEGDIKGVCTDFKKQNKQEKKGQSFFLFKDDKTLPSDRLGSLATAYYKIDEVADDTIASLQDKQKQYEQFVKSTSYEFGHLLADAWCSAFVIKKDKTFDYLITEKIFRDIEKNPHNLAPWLKTEILRLARQYQFFHWHMEFPSVFQIPAQDQEPDNAHTGLSGGFDCVLGNPPWEKVKLQEKEWFAQRNPDIANAPNAAARKRLIERLKTDNPAMFQAFLDDSRKAEGESHLIRNGGGYPYCGRGDINTYSIFAELKRNLISPNGRVGCLVPSGIATDDTTKFFFQNLTDAASLVSLYDFENREGLFPAVDSRMKFCLLTLTGSQKPAKSGADFVFFATNTSHLIEKDRHFSLSSDEIALLNPNTRTCPIFRRKADAELTKHIYRRVPVLIKEAHDDKQTEENPWGIGFLRMFDMSNDSHLFRTREQLEEDGWQLDGNIFRKDDQEYLPLYEAKMVTLWDHRSSRVIRSDTATIRQAQPENLSLAEHEAADIYAMPLYWVKQSDVLAYTPEIWRRQWTCGWRRVSSSTNERTFLQTTFPRAGFGDSIFLMYITESLSTAPAMLSSLTTFGFDYFVRQKMGGVNLSFFLVAQLPVLIPSVFFQPFPSQGSPCSLRDWLLTRVLELTYTAWDLELFAKDCGYDGPPFRWDEERRFLLRCELDAAFFHLYLGTDSEWKEKGSKELMGNFPTPRHAVDYIMDTFPIVKRKDEQQYGSYRTKDKILEIYNNMTESIRTGKPYQTILDPPPADPSVAHPPRKSPDA
jgi:hypothetical protein